MSAHVPSKHEVETFSGRYVDTKNPKPDTITLEDVAHALSQTCRYGGHCQRFYSVAEHAVLVSCRLQQQGFSKPYQIAGLHHDDAEAFLGDIPRPMKSLLGQAYVRLTEKMDLAIAEALQIGVRPDLFHFEAVKDADNWALFVEARHLLPSKGKHWWDGDQGAAEWGLPDKPSRIVVPSFWTDGLPPQEARDLYLFRHKYLMEGV